MKNGYIKFRYLTKIITLSPFDTILLNQKESLCLFGKYDENHEIEDCVFEEIKTSLVFFNQKEGSINIISNNNKYYNEYYNLKALNNWQNLVDYKNRNMRIL